MGQTEYKDRVEKPLNKVDDLRNLIDLPEGADFLGYLVYDGENEEFLIKDAKEHDKPIWKFSKIPHCAYRFKTFAEANKQVHRHNCESVVALFDLGSEQLLVAQIQDESESDSAVH